MENSSTKQRILEAAITLFNEQGIANVRLTQISDEAKMSVGNLAYHYKNKEAIVEAVYEQLFEEFAEVLAAYVNDNALLDFDKQISDYFEFFKHNRYYLLNTFEVARTYPSIHSRWQRNVNKMILQLRKRLDFFEAEGYMQNERDAGDHDYLAQNVWTTVTFWIPQQLIRGKALRNDMYRRAVWALVIPFLTKRGYDQYRNSIRPLIHHL